MVHEIILMVLKYALKLSIIAHVRAKILGIRLMLKIASPQIMPAAAQFVHQGTPQGSLRTSHKNSCHRASPFCQFPCFEDDSVQQTVLAASQAGVKLDATLVSKQARLIVARRPCVASRDDIDMPKLKTESVF